MRTTDPFLRAITAFFVFFLFPCCCRGFFLFPFIGASSTAAAAAAGAASSLVIPPAMLGGLVIIKAAALAAAGLVLGAGSWAKAHQGLFNGEGKRRNHHQRRMGRRSSSHKNDDGEVFALVARTEVDHCYRRYICDLAAGGMSGTTENDVILSLFKEEVGAASPKFVYAEAARFGKRLGDVRACEMRYTCPLDGQQIDRLLPSVKDVLQT